jgi:signal transduction histidine kinase
MRRAVLSLVLSVAAAVAASAIGWAIYGGHAFVSSLEILAPVGAAATLLATLIGSRRSPVTGLRRRLGAVAILVAAQLGAAVALFAGLMFVSDHDALFMGLAAAYAALIGLTVARLVTRNALDDLDAIRAALAQVAGGAREVRIPVRGDDELAQLAADVEAMVARVAAEESARRELVAAVSHDLRTPLTTLRLIAEGLEDGIFEPDTVREQVRLMSVHVRALGGLVDDLFELSRLEAGDVSWSIEQVHLDQLVQETIQAMRPQAQAGGVAVRAELENGLRPARGNPEQLQRVLFNLIQNAIRHTPADGSVVVRARPGQGRAIEVEVADTGHGIDPALGDRIFEPFVQGPSRVAGQNGAGGLGLAIARAIVAAHGGRIWLCDDSGPAHPAHPGARIRFTLPVEG